MTELAPASISPEEELAPGIPAAPLEVTPRWVVPTHMDWPIWLSWLPTLAFSSWLAGSLAWFLLLAYRVTRFQRLLRFAVPAPADVQEHAQGLAERLRLSTCPTLWMVPGAVSPMLWGIVGRPRLLIPAELWKNLDWSQRGALLTHELAHFRRRDHWVRGLELMVTGLYWWHPVVWWARHELRESEEQCCDAWVLWALPAAAKSYASALVETVDFLSQAAAPLPVPASGFGHVHQLKRRLTMILRGSTPRALTWAGGLCVLGLGALLLPLWPTWGQPPERERPGRGPGEGERRVEGQPRRDGEAGAKRVEGEDRERAQQMEQARQEVERLRDQLRRAEERLQSLSGRRPDATPRPGGSGGSDRRPDPTPGGERKPDAPRGGFGGFGGGGLGGLGGGLAGGGATVNLERRLSEVEKKLERLLEIMERRGPGPFGGGGPAGPGGGDRPGIRGPGPNPPTPPRDRDPERKPDKDK